MADQSEEYYSPLDPSEIGAGSDLRFLLEKRVVGQSDALDKYIAAYQTYRAGLVEPEKPAGSFLLLGPTGTGKTSSVEAFCRALAGPDKRMLRIDCGEYVLEHNSARLLGSPPGYLGSEIKPVLRQEVLTAQESDTNEISFVLFDEIEKADHAITSLLLGILDKAVMQLGNGERVSFAKTMVFLTANVGAKEMQVTGRPSHGFHDCERKAPGKDKLIDIAMSAARRQFTPELINRIDHVIVFQTLEDQHLREILDIELEMLNYRLFTKAGCPCHLFFSQEVKDLILKEGCDTRYGARFLKRTLQRKVVLPLSNLISSGQIKSQDNVRVSMDSAGSLIFEKQIAAAAA